MKWNKTNSLGIGILGCLQIIPSERSLEPLYYSSFVFATLVYGVIGINFVDHFLNQGAPAEHKSAETPIGHESVGSVEGNAWRGLGHNNMAGAIIPTLMHQIPSELRNEGCLGESSTWMGDLLGSPRVHPFSIFLMEFLWFISAFVKPIGFTLPISIRTSQSSFRSPNR